MPWYGGSITWGTTFNTVVETKLDSDVDMNLLEIRRRSAERGGWEVIIIKSKRMDGQTDGFFSLPYFTVLYSTLLYLVMS